MISNEEMDTRLIQLSKKMGAKNSEVFLSVLGKDKAFLSALDTSVGQELLKDATSSIQRIILLIMNEKDGPQDRAELKAYLSITKRWQTILNNYNKNQKEFNKLTGNGK